MCFTVNVGLTCCLPPCVPHAHRLWTGASSQRWSNVGHLGVPHFLMWDQNLGPHRWRLAGMGWYLKYQYVDGSTVYKSQMELDEGSDWGRFEEHWKRFWFSATWEKDLDQIWKNSNSDSHRKNNKNGHTPTRLDQFCLQCEGVQRPSRELSLENLESRHLHQKPEPPQLTPSDEEQQFYSETPPQMRFWQSSKFTGGWFDPWGSRGDSPAPTGWETNFSVLVSLPERTCRVWWSILCFWGPADLVLHSTDQLTVLTTN